VIDTEKLVKKKTPKAKGFLSSNEEQPKLAKGKAVDFDPTIMKGVSLSKRGSRAVPICASKIVAKLGAKIGEMNSTPTEPTPTEPTPSAPVTNPVPDEKSTNSE